MIRSQMINKVLEVTRKIEKGAPTVPLSLWTAVKTNKVSPSRRAAIGGPQKTPYFHITRDTSFSKDMATELKQRGRKNYTEKTSVTLIASSTPSSGCTNTTESDDRADDVPTNTGTHSSPHRDSNSNANGIAAPNKTKLSLHAKMVIVLLVCMIVSGASIGVAMFKKRAQQRAVDSRRRRTAIGGHDFDGEVGGGRYSGDEHDEQYYFERSSGQHGRSSHSYDDDDGGGGADGNNQQQHNYGPSLAPLLRNALFENNKAHLGIASNLFVHGNEKKKEIGQKKKALADNDDGEEAEDEVSNSKPSDPLLRRDFNDGHRFSNENNGDDDDDEEEREERLLLAQLEDQIANRDVPMASDLARVRQLKQKFAQRLVDVNLKKMKRLQGTDIPAIKTIRRRALNSTEFYIAVGQSEPVHIIGAALAGGGGKGDDSSADASMDTRRFFTRSEWTSDFMRLPPLVKSEQTGAAELSNDDDKHVVNVHRITLKNTSALPPLSPQRSTKGAAGHRQKQSSLPAPQRNGQQQEEEMDWDDFVLAAWGKATRVTDNQSNEEDDDTLLRLAEENIDKLPPHLAADVDEDKTVRPFASFAVLDRKQLEVEKISFSSSCKARAKGDMVNQVVLEASPSLSSPTSPLRHEQWDRVICQLKGSRTFTLFDPLQIDRLYPKKGSDRHDSRIEDPLLYYKGRGIIMRRQRQQQQQQKRQREDAMRRSVEEDQLALAEAEEAVAYATLVDAKYPLFAHARRYEVTLEEGDMLVLPAFWWSQQHSRIPSSFTDGDDSFSKGSMIMMALTYWYVPASLMGELLYDLLLPDGPLY